MINANMANKRGLFIFSFRIENKYSKEYIIPNMRIGNIIAPTNMPIIEATSTTISAMWVGDANTTKKKLNIRKIIDAMPPMMLKRTSRTAFKRE